MQFVVWATDADDALAVRQRVREQHRARLRHPAPHNVQVLMAGPTLDESNNTMNGTLLVVEAHSAEAVRAFVQGDPYQRHGVYRDVQIRPWRCGLGPLAEPAPNSIERP
jgi:uncharacterized protein